MSRVQLTRRDVLLSIAATSAPEPGLEESNNEGGYGLRGYGEHRYGHLLDVGTIDLVGDDDGLVPDVDSNIEKRVERLIAEAKNRSDGGDGNDGILESIGERLESIRDRVADLREPVLVPLE